MGCKCPFAFLAALLACLAPFSINVVAAQTSSSITTIALVQSANVEGSGVASLSHAFPNPNTAGDLIIVFVRMSTTAQTVQVSDSVGNMYKEAISQVQDDDGHQIHIFYAANVLSGINTVTAKFSDLNNHPWLAVFEYSGVATANPLDVTSAAQGSSTDASSGSPVQTHAANELVFAAVGLPSGSSTTINAGAGFSLESQDINTPGSRAGVEDQINSGSGTVVGNFALAGAANWTAVIATFTSAQLTISTASLPQGMQGVFYKANVQATGGVPPYSWTISGSLPPGMSFDATGFISGTPTSTGSYSFSVQVSDAQGNTAAQTLQIQVSSPHDPIVLVQYAGATGNAVSTLSQSFPTGNTAGNLIIAFVRMSTTSQTVQVSDTSGNVYQEAVQQAQSVDGHQTHIFYAANIASGGNTITARFSDINNHPWLAIYEYRGLDPVAPLDKTAHAEGSSSVANSGATQSTSSASELVFGGVGLPASSTQTVASDSGFTLMQQDAPPDNSRAGNEQMIVSSTGSYASSFALSGVANWTAVLATFLPPAPAHAQLTANPATIDFGSVTSGSNSTQSITVTNVGTTSASITQLTASGTGFTVNGLNLPYNLGANASATFQITFAPDSPGTYSGSADLFSDATNSPLNVALKGTATRPPQAQITASPSSLNFGSLNIGSSSSQTITLVNSGNATATLTQVSEAGSGFSVSGLATPYTLAAGATVSVTATFAPATASTYSGSISILSDAANSPLTVSLSGNGTQVQQAQLSSNPASVTFGGLSAGSNAIQTVTLTNTGNAAANISQISVSGAGFSVSGITVPLVLSAGGAVSFQVKFSPALAGAYSETVAITSDAPNSPLGVSLSGTATHSVALNWTDGDSGIAGYNVYRADQSGGPYSKISSALLLQNGWADGSVQSGHTYYYVVTASGTSGVESAYSSEVTVLIPNP